jgi:solute carrier family 15 oligopeptide transporter 1
MKALVQALWLLTMAFGNLIIVIITLLSLFENMALELLFYAAVMLVVIVVFALMSIFYYEYNSYTSEKKDEDDDVTGTDNSGFEQDADEKPKFQ